MTTGPCACKISGPLGIGAVLGEAPVRVIEGGPCYGITYCPTHAAAPEMLAELRRLISKGECLCNGDGVRLVKKGGQGRRNKPDDFIRVPCERCEPTRALLARIEGIVEEG